MNLHIIKNKVNPKNFLADKESFTKFTLIQNTITASMIRTFNDIVDFLKT